MEHLPKTFNTCSPVFWVGVHHYLGSLAGVRPDFSTAASTKTHIKIIYDAHLQAFKDRTEVGMSAVVTLPGALPKRNSLYIHT